RLQSKRIARADRPRPAQFIHAQTDRTAREPEPARDKQFHRHRRSVPAARNETPEDALLRRPRVQMKRLRIERLRESDDVVFTHRKRIRFKSIADMQVFEVFLVHRLPFPLYPLTQSAMAVLNLSRKPG